ncbi:helix-turn-helix transcriptional regulator [Amycolatopsis rhizosphaerae]|uniref:helix-turn-helix transcriptional regulator n=1 Tax=Amycolatopsis rhizosphaerae TaxID=2053003 RepID=UPI001FEC0EDF|nr:LuxR C-terminal-related transcriptional regulator [Amycolatopsis rhizosphaerae]
MARQRAELAGRQDVFDVLRWDGTRPAFTLVRGVSGSGRTAVLARACRELRDSGFVVLEVAGAGERADWDLFGVRPVLGSVREQFEQIGADPRLVGAIDLVSRLCTAEVYASPWQRSSLLSALVTLFARIRATRPVALVVDDACRIPQPLFVLAAAHRAGYFVVASAEADARGEPAELAALADRVIDLSPLTDEDVDSLLRQVANGPVDEAARRALRDGLGPLYGNPGTLVSTVAELRRRDRLIVAGGRLCLRDPSRPVGLPAGHALLASVEGDVGRNVVVLAASETGFGIDDVPVLAEATGHPVADYGRAIDRLVADGILEGGATGRLRCRCPALAVTAVEEIGEDAVRRLHREIAVRLLDAPAPDGRARSLLAGHVAAAGRALPSRPGLVAVLRDEENRMGPLDPARLARYRYAAWWHATGTDERARLRSEVVRALVHAAEYARLAEFIAEVVECGGPAFDSGARAELSAAAALAAIHCGRPVRPSVRRALSGPGDTGGPFAFADRWFAGEAVLPEQVAASFAPVWLRHWSATPTIDGRTRHRKQSGASVETACAHRDLVPVFRAVLGSDYRSPTAGPVAVHHRVFTGYTDGEWASALSAARELELTGQADERALWCARILAAEMCWWRGEDRQAKAWLDAVPEDSPFPAMRAWVALGMRHHAGDDGAFDEGWRQYRAHAEGADEPGAARLLVRLASVAVESGRSYLARTVLGEVESRYAGRDRGDLPAEPVLLVRGLVEVDPVAIRSAERLVRRRGNRLDLALACQLVGRIAGEPRPWLEEAYHLARSIGATRLVARTRTSLKCTQAPAPPTAGRGPELSDVELRIIELIRQGKTNRQIALTLRVSAKTVEKHLTRLFAKAGCRTRHGLAMSGLGGGLETIGA